MATRAFTINGKTFAVTSSKDDYAAIRSKITKALTPHYYTLIKRVSHVMEMWTALPQWSLDDKEKEMIKKFWEDLPAEINKKNMKAVTDSCVNFFGLFREKQLKNYVD